jgi:hypothetical protein
MKKSGLLACFLLISPFFYACKNTSNTLKIFISSNKDVDIKAIKNKFSSYDLEISFANPSNYYYSFLYKTSREKRYDIFIIRDEEFLTSDIKNIYVELNNENFPKIVEKTYSFYQVEEKNYAIKLNDSNYLINELISFEEGHDYYIGLAKMSENVGDYSIYSAKSTKAFDLLSDLL